MQDKKRLLEELLWNTDASEYSRHDSIQQLVREFEEALPKLKKIAQSEIPEATLSKIIELIQSIDELALQAHGGGDSKELQQKFSLIKFDDNEVANGPRSESRKQSIFLEDEIITDPPFMVSTMIQKVATMAGPGVILEIYQLESAKTIFMLLNYTQAAMRNVRINLSAEKVWSLKIKELLPMESATLIESRLFEPSLMDITIAFESLDDFPTTIKLAVQK